MAACWATNVVVNGMGPAMQRFWLANNLIAQIPGAGDAGRQHSVAWAKAGHGVLLHPEGSVGWHGDRIGHLFAGAVEMALQAAMELRESGQGRGVFLAPVVWKLKLMRDVRKALAAEIAYVEKRLDLPSARPGADPAERVRHAYDMLLARDEAEIGVPRGEGGGLAARQARLVARLGRSLREILGARAPEEGASPERLLRLAERLIRQSPPEDRAAIEARRLARTLRRQRRFEPAFYPDETLSQEHVAESIKRLRGDYCEGSFRDTMNKLVPRPAGPRIAHIRVPEPLDITRALGSRAGLGEAAVDALVAELKRRMQHALDRLNSETAASGPQIRFANPFL
jgi:hypothetical protein